MPRAQRLFVSSLLAALASTGPAIAQAVTVGPAGSGAMFPSIQAGIAAAPPGGVVIVAAGDYQATGSIVVDKPLTLLGAGFGSTFYTALSSFPYLGSPLPLLVSGLASGERVVISGFTLRSFPFAGGGPNGALSLAVVDCQGPVVIADVFAAGSITQFPVAAFAHVRDSAIVTFDGCTLLAGATGDIQPPAGLRIERSLVHLNGCTVRGATPGVSFGSGVTWDGAPGIAAVDATVRIAGCEVIGGNGNQPNPFSPAIVPTEGGAAVRATGSRVHVRGGGGNLLRGGTGGTASANGVPSYGAGGAALWIDAASVGSTTPDVVALAGPDGNLQVQTPPVDGPGLFAPLAFRLATIAASPPLVAPGGAAQLALGGEPFAICLPLCALGLSTGFALPGVHGLLTLSGIVTLPATVLDANGLGSGSLAVPSSLSLVGTVVHSQSLSFGPGGWISVSAPTTFAVR